MSIDARVKAVRMYEDGSGALVLEDRPPRREGDHKGIAGQSQLFFQKAPEEVTALNGLDIWGGASEIMLGDTKIAERRGYTLIEFLDRENFNRAVVDYTKEKV